MISVRGESTKGGSLNKNFGDPSKPLTKVPGQLCHSGTPTSSAGKRLWTKLQLLGSGFPQTNAKTAPSSRKSGDKDLFLWDPNGYSGNSTIVLDDTRESLERLFKNVEFVGTPADNRWALEKRIDVYICGGAKFGRMTDLWPRVKRWR